MGIWYTDILQERAVCLSDSANTAAVEVHIDGYITNRKKLLEKLHLKATSDTASLVSAVYERDGINGLYKLDGSFALLMIDRKRGAFLLYRSFLTGPPLYFTCQNNRLSVSTNPVTLLSCEGLFDTLDHGQMSALFALETEAWNGTVFSDLQEVEHGEAVLVSIKGMRRIRRPLAEVFSKPDYGSESEMIERYRYLVQKAIEKHIAPNKTYGIMLSSGMDSSTLAFFASQQLKRYGKTLRAYSWTLPNYPKADETEKIKILCRELDIPLTLVEVEHLDPFSNLDRLPLKPDLPFSNLYSVMITEVYAHASMDGVDVLFNGHYGDELFPSTSTLFIDILKEGRYELLMPTAVSILHQTGYRHFLKSTAVRGFLRTMLPFLKGKKSGFHVPIWLSADAKKCRETVRVDQKVYKRFSSALSKVNTSSGMGRYLTKPYHLERIEPYADADLLNYMLHLPAYMVYRDGKSKYIAREAMKGLLPDSIRLQPRVGMLGQFAEESFRKNVETVQERLFKDVQAWNLYVDEKWMREKFKTPIDIKGKELLVVWMCLNLGAWKKAICPGGSLYEDARI